MRTDNPHIGSGLDELLAEDGSLEEVGAIAVKRVIAWQLAEAMKSEGVSKKALALRMHTSRTQIDRMLDKKDTGLTLETLSRAASALGFRVNFSLEPAG